MLMPELIAAHVGRALAFVAIVNREDVFPTKAHVDAFVGTQPPAARAHPLSLTQMAYEATLLRDHSLATPVSDYLLQTGLAIEHGGGLKLTKVGAALRTGVERYASHGSSDQEVLEVVGRLDDPITYARLLTEIDKQQRALVIDPYLPSGDLLTLIELASVERVLTRDIGTHGQGREERKRHLAIALGARPEVQLRFLPPEVKELHDRLVLPRSEGAGLMIGTSLGGSQVTVISHLSEDTTSVLRGHYEALWVQGEPLEPIERIGAVAESGYDGGGS
jgi:hypothetical protein